MASPLTRLGTRNLRGRIRCASDVALQRKFFDSSATASATGLPAAFPAVDDSARRDCRASGDAGQMGLTAPRLFEQGMVDTIISEPLGGGRSDAAESARRVKAAVLGEFDALERRELDTLLDQRYARPGKHGSHLAA
jgi:hypothetical protein